MRTTRTALLMDTMKKKKIMLGREVGARVSPKIKHKYVAGACLNTQRDDAL